MAEDDDDVRHGVSDEQDPVLAQQNDSESERGEELCGDEDIAKAALEVFQDVEKGFQDQWERSNEQLDFWELYHCLLGPKQFYTGNSKIYVPIVHDAVEARKTRFVNQIFPQSGRNVEVTASETKPHEVMSLLEHYIRKSKLRTKVVPALVKNGDVEGQYNLYVGWTRNERHVMKRVKRAPTVEGLVETVSDEYDDIEEETIIHQYPSVEVLADADVLVLPRTADSIEGAVDDGGSVSIIRRWSKSKIRKMIRDEEIDEEGGRALLKEMSKKVAENVPNKAKAMLDAAGIKGDGKSAQVYETWTKLKVDGERRIVRIYFAGEDNILSVKRNPYWNDKVPVLSAPVDREQGTFKGLSKLRYVETIQYQANDAVNEAMDSAAYALLPIVMTDPDRNPRVGSMVLNMAAIWETSPKDTQFAQFPQLWKDGLSIVSSCKEQIFQTLSVNPAMMPQQMSANKGGKPNQAMIANEQQVDILTTADAVTNLEGEILTPLLEWFVALDHQFREVDITIRAFGPMGVHAAMEVIEPIQMGRRFEFRWFGVEAARSQQQIQTQMASLNVLRGIQPQYYPGYKINLVPIISQLVENTFGPRLAPLIFEDIRHQLTLDPKFENTMLEGGYHVPVNPLDNDQEHMKAHQEAFQQMGDLTGAFRQHMMLHAMQMQQKAQAQQMQAMQQQQGQPGTPGGAGPGVAGTPRRGAAPAGPRPNGQGPPGMIHQDRMPLAAPRPSRM